MGDIIHCLILARPPPKGVTHPCLHVLHSVWLHPSFLSGWASFLARPGFPPNESWGSRVIVFKITSVCYLAEQELVRVEQGCPVGLSPVASLPALASSVQFFYLTGSNGQAWSIAPSPSYSQQPLSLWWSPGPSMVFVPLNGCKLVGELPFPGDSLLPIKLFVVGELPSPPSSPPSPTLNFAKCSWQDLMRPGWDGAGRALVWLPWARCLIY